MKLFVLSAFVRWIFAALGQSLRKADKNFRRMVDDEFWLGFLLWFLITALISIPVGLTAIFFTPVEHMYYVRYVMSTYLGIAIGYFVCTGISIMYENFQRDQQHLINELKR